MPHEVIFQLVIYFSVVGLIFSLIVAAGIKFFEQTLTFRQAFLISLATNFVTFVLLITYHAAKPQLGIPRDVDNLVEPLVTLMLTGAIITRLSANYGIKKVGWLGLGAKVALVLSWIIVFAMALLIYPFGK